MVKGIRREYIRELAALAAFSVAFGYLEAAVVVYLREIAACGESLFPLEPLPPKILAAETGREAATLAMLVAASAMTAGRPLLKFARFLFAFGVWDLVYYGGLKTLIDWPASIWDWDVLFLIPAPWFAPVAAPAAVAALFVVVGVFGIATRGAVTPRLWQWATAAGGAVLVLLSFLWNTRRVLAGGVPGAYPWPAFIIGFIFMLGSFMVVVLWPKGRGEEPGLWA